MVCFIIASHLLHNDITIKQIKNVCTTLKRLSQGDRTLISLSVNLLCSSIRRPRSNYRTNEHQGKWAPGQMDTRTSWHQQAIVTRPICSAMTALPNRWAAHSEILRLVLRFSNGNRMINRIQFTSFSQELSWNLEDLFWKCPFVLYPFVLCSFVRCPSVRKPIYSSL